VKREDLAGIEISAVLGSWETHYSVSQIDSDRTYNLKVGADHLNGHILKPHELFSFNEVVGDRTEKEGYRVAPVISGGELIDGLAGGMCQIASTLHAAAFFAGLEIVSSTPHSRPSAYIPLGLDATVVYPTTDLKLRNPFDFPIVMHYQVNQGAVKVELLGKSRPYKVLFEREILEEHGFGTEAEKWTVHYPTTSEIVAIGAGPPTLKKKPPPPAHHIPPVPKGDKPIARILR
jgi:vancomycin resistance protein YoaR